MRLKRRVRSRDGRETAAPAAAWDRSEAPGMPDRQKADPMKRRAGLAAIALAALLRLPLAGEQPASDLSFLVGHWAGAGSGEPGRGVGSFSFQPDLQGRVLVRRAHSEYPATAVRPETVHDDLLIVYAESAKAVYFDNEGHVIHYDITSDAQSKTATFLSTDPRPAPLFRLTYRQTSPDELRVTFEISPTGRAADAKPYVSGIVRRQTARP